MNKKLAESAIGWIASRLGRQVEVALAECELSAAQYRILFELGDGAEMSTALAQKVAVSAPTVSTVVDGLVHLGAVVRTHSEDDRRRVTIALTPAGRDLLAAADAAVLARLTAAVDTLESCELKAEAIQGFLVIGEALDRARTLKLDTGFWGGRDSSSLTSGESSVSGNL